MKLNTFRFAICLLSLSAVMVGSSTAFARNNTISKENRGLSGNPTQIVEGPTGSPAAASQKGTATVSCPAGWTLSGGGFIVPDFNNGTGTIADVNESRASSTASNGVTTWTWTVTYRNTGAGTVTAKAQVICLDPTGFAQPLKSTVVKSAQVIINPLQSQTVIATCPSGTILSGGGYDVNDGSNSAVVHDNYPNGADWNVYVFNVDLLRRVQVQAYAVCMS